jgi:hypothetical protein
MKVGVFGYEDTCIKVYDPTNQEMIRMFTTYTRAANGLGLTTSVVTNACTDKKRRFSPVLNKEIAIRLSKK